MHLLCFQLCRLHFKKMKVYTCDHVLEGQKVSTNMKNNALVARDRTTDETIHLNVPKVKIPNP